MSNALPLIKNASPLRLKLMAMAVGEVLEVSPEELPASYKSVKIITSRIQKHYAYYFAVLKLSDKPGWRVLRVNTAEEAESFVPKRKKEKSAKQDEPVRLYNMSDAALGQLIDEKIIFARRDAAALVPRGVTSAKLDALALDNEAFKAMDSDVQTRADETIAADHKVAARNTLESRVGNLRSMAENTFGSNDISYTAFGFEGMVNETDDGLLRLAKRALRQGNTNQAAMAQWGCSPAFLTQLGTDIQTFDTEIDNVQTAETDRNKATVLRVNTGNNLYTRVDKICNTGKDVYRESNPAKHSDYFIYS